MSYLHHQELASISADFQETFGQLSQEQLNWKPSTEQWSIAQNIDHIIRINESYYPLIQDLKEGKADKSLLARIPFFVRLFGNLIYTSVQAENSKKLKTLGIWKPKSTPLSTEIIEKLVTHNEQLADLISSCHSLIEEGAIISSPANKNIVYKLERAFEILISHEKRHLEQARRAPVSLLKS